jgi:hypothetical protein
MGVTLLPSFDCEDCSALDDCNRPTEIGVTVGDDGVTVVASHNDVTSSIDSKKCLTLHTDNDVTSSIDRKKCLTVHTHNDPYPDSVTLEIYMVLFKAVENVVSWEHSNVENIVKSKNCNVELL